MITIRLEIERIDYEKSVQQLLPQVIDRCTEATEPGEVEKFLAKLGADAMPVAKKLLSYLDDSVKDEIIVWLGNAHREKLVNVANQTMEGLCAGKVICIRDLSAEDRPGPRFAIQATQVSVDYPALLKSPMVASAIDQIGPDGSVKKGAVRMAADLGARIPAESLEKAAISLVTNERVKGKLLSALSAGLQKIGLIVELRDMLLWTDTDTELPDEIETEPGDEGLIPDAFEDSLMDALCAFLKDAVK